MLKKLTILLFCYALTPLAFAQKYILDSVYTVETPYGYIMPFDSLEVVTAANNFEIEANLLNFDTTSAINIFETTHDYDLIPIVSNDVIKDRLSCMKTQIPMHFHERVRVFIDFFAIKKREYILKVMEKKHLYFPIYERIFAEYGMPEEIKYLSVVESALVPTALSRAGARGLWQFMPATGKLMGLRQDSFIDERLDPEKSTRAAARYLAYLYKLFGDWELALAAYNCGPGNVRKAIKRSGGKFHFWDIYPYLPAETRSYVPQFVAIAYVLTYAEEHNLIVERPEYPIDYEDVYFSQAVGLQSLADMLNVCIEDLRTLNPELQRDIIPANAQNYALKIPAARYRYFNENREIILDSLKKNPKITTAMQGSLVYHTVRSGESIAVIAQKYGITATQIRTWNKLKNNDLLRGQKLIIYSNKTKSYLPPQNTTTSTTATYTKNASYHIVRSGDTLWDIANKYNITVQQLKLFNQMSSTALKIGQKLRVK
jgi:membrane-bound lytic murein transglycosylase D